MAKKSRNPHRTALILAAGKGTRFLSDKAKVLHSLCGKPIVEHIFDGLKATRVRKTILVVGHQAEAVEAAFAARDIEFVRQTRQLGTGHAVITAAPRFKRLSGNLLVLYGDTPLIKGSTLRKLFQTHERKDADLTLLTSEVDDPSGYGRVIRDAGGEIVAIVEDKDADASQKQIREMNPGFYCFKIRSLAQVLPRLAQNNRQREYYLTDLIAIFREWGGKIATVKAPAEETAGINDRVQLAEAERFMRREIARKWMEKGVTLLDPESVLIDQRVRIGPDTVLYPGVVLEGQSRIGKGCVIHSYCHLRDTRVGDGALIDHCSVLRDSSVGAASTVGPFAHLRQNSAIGERARVGNFVEIKKSKLGDRVKAAHLTYLGDARIGDKVNVGAGTITCNYDGFHKHKTVIEEGAFIGSDSQLVAPVKIGAGAYVAAGSSITENVPPRALAIARGRQVNKAGWADRKKGKRKT